MSKNSKNNSRGCKEVRRLISEARFSEDALGSGFLSPHVEEEIARQKDDRKRAWIRDNQDAVVQFGSCRAFVFALTRDEKWMIAGRVLGYEEGDLQIVRH